MGQFIPITFKKNHRSLDGLARPLLATAALSLALPSGPLAAQGARAIAFDIPAEPLAQALADFSRESDVLIVAASELTAGKRSRAINLTTTAEEALKLLLEGSNLTYTLGKDGSIVIKRAVADTPAPAAQHRTSAQPSTDEQDSPVLQEVLVTAQRKVESLQSVPIAVTAVSADELAQTHIESSTDLSRYVPSLFVGGSFRENQSFTLRGLGNAGGGPSVVSYFAEVPDLGPPVGSGFVSSGGSGPGLFYDLESVQVLKGPQGTLFGQSTVGGAVLFTPRKPTSEFGGYLRVQGGNYNDREIQGAVNLPIVRDTLLVRVAGSSARRDGFTRVVSSGVDLDNRHYDAARVTILFTPNDTFSNTLLFNGIDNDNNGGSFVLDPGRPINQPYYPQLAAVAAPAQAALGPRKITDIFGNGVNVRPRFHEKHWFVGDTAELQASDTVKVRNILAYQRVQLLNNFDMDGTPLPIVDIATAQGWNVQLQQLTEELQLQGESLRNTLQWTAGVYLSHVSPFGPQVTDRYMFTKIGGPNTPNVIRPDDEAQSQALYAQGTYDLGALSASLSRFKLTAGFRYTWDRRTAADGEILPNGKCGNPATSTPPDCIARGAANFGAPSWNLTLDYGLNESTRAYVATRRGYIPGGLNLTSPIPGTQSFGPEKLTDVELGLKSDWKLGGMPIRTNVAAYYGRFKDVQTTQNVVDDQLKFYSVIQNIAAQTIHGIELETQLLPARGVEIAASYSYTDARIDQYAPGVAVRDPVFFGMPHHKGSLSVSYQLPLPANIGDVRLSATETAQSLSYGTSAPVTVDALRMPGYAALSFNAEWNNVMSTRVDLSLFVTNALDKVYDVGTTGGSSFGFVVVNYNEPRMFGAALRYRFGGEK